MIEVRVLPGKKKKKVLKITLALVSGRRKIQARCKNLVKVRVKFIRRGTGRRKERETNISYSPHCSL
jgi:hypothetical protein